MHPKNISIADFTYLLPEEKIAVKPLGERDHSKLLIYSQQKIEEDLFGNISHWLPGNSLLVFNNSKVIEARIVFQKPTGGLIEIFCLGPHKEYSDVALALQQHGKVKWQCMIGGASKWKTGQVLSKEMKQETGVSFTITATYIEKHTDYFDIEFAWTATALSFAEILHFVGAIPLPPYLKRNADAEDHIRYQTVYASLKGSVAAPTAGLHFTNKILNDLDKKNIKKEFLSLHVGAGTFKPVKSQTMNEHSMHFEYFQISKLAIENLLNNLDETIVAVGSTSFRSIESLYWLGATVKDDETENQTILSLPQWKAYDAVQNLPSAKQALTNLLEWMHKAKQETLMAKTQIIIAPGYSPRITNGLVTNFHQPNSTLLLLVAACIADDWKKVYQYALENNFRFLSYGDSSLLLF